MNEYYVPSEILTHPSLGFKASNAGRDIRLHTDVE
jgi:hypothetical protein